MTAQDKSCMGDLISFPFLRVRHPTPAQCCGCTAPSQGLWDHRQTQASFLQSFIQEKKKGAKKPLEIKIRQCRASKGEE